MKIDVILLSGTPASGKDTLTIELNKIDNRFVHFKKHKIASGGKMDDTYYLISKNEFDSMAKHNQFVQYHYRYDRGYGVSADELKKLKELNKIPVIHVGKYENIIKFKEFGIKNILSILICADKDITKKRLELRHSKDSSEIDKRLNAYDEEIEQLCDVLNNRKVLDFDLVFKNNYQDYSDASQKLYNQIKFFEENMNSIYEVIDC